MTSDVFKPFGSARMPKDVPTAAATSAPVGITARSTKHTVSPCSATRRAATWLAIDVFPTPPGPSSVTSRSRLNSSVAVAITLERPTTGRLAGRRDPGASCSASRGAVDRASNFGSCRRIAFSVARTEALGSSPSSSSRPRRSRPRRSRASACRPHRYSASARRSHKPSRNGLSAATSSNSATTASCLPAARSASAASSIMSSRCASTWRATASAEASSRSPANGTPAKSASAERANRPASPMFPEYAAARARSTQWLKRWRSIASRSRRRT